MAGIKLGQSDAYPDTYDATLLEPIPRAMSRSLLGGNTQFSGRDYWHAYEVSWLAPSGVPQVAIAEFSLAASSKNIIESKSFKYYLNSFNQSVFESRNDVVARLTEDLSAVAVGELTVALFDVDDSALMPAKLPGRCIDQTPCDIQSYQPLDGVLRVDSEQHVKDYQLHSHLLKSNCPVTGQPDWASLWIQYSGQKLDEASLLKYIVGFRQYQGFHESCVERIHHDIMQQCKPTELAVYARYTRRGGLDINPYRTTNAALANTQPFGRSFRQ